MQRPNKSGDHKVIISNGDFFIAMAGDDRFSEAYASQNERKRLMVRVGLINGQLPGLLESYARFLVSRLQASRKGNRRNSRRRV